MAGLNIVSIVATALILAAVAADGRVLIGTYPSLLPPVPAPPPAGTPSRTSATVYACTARGIRFDVCNGLKAIPGVMTPWSLLEAAVWVLLAKARAAKGKFAEARKSSRAGNSMASILQSCTKNYDDLVCMLEEAARSINKAHGSNYNVVTKMTAASTYVCDCENWFEERGL